MIPMDPCDVQVRRVALAVIRRDSTQRRGPGRRLLTRECSRRNVQWLTAGTAPSPAAGVWLPTSASSPRPGNRRRGDV